MLNKVLLIGHVGNDPEIKKTNDGKALSIFSIATSESWKDKATGEKKQATEWHRCVCFQEGLVEVIRKYVKKGSKIYIEGQIKTRKWEQDGVEKYATEIVIKQRGKLVLLDKAEKNSPPDDSYSGDE